MLVSAFEEKNPTALFVMLCYVHMFSNVSTLPDLLLGTNKQIFRKKLPFLLGFAHYLGNLA